MKNPAHFTVFCLQSERSCCTNIVNREAAALQEILLCGRFYVMIRHNNILYSVIKKILSKEIDVWKVAAKEIHRERSILKFIGDKMDQIGEARVGNQGEEFAQEMAEAFKGDSNLSAEVEVEVEGTTVIVKY